MFSQFRSVVESLSQNAPNGAPNPLRSSMGSPNFNQPVMARPLANSPSILSSPALSSPPPRAKATLEERLRANFALGEASEGSTPIPSGQITPLYREGQDLGPDPASVPLPSSPPQSPKEELQDVVPDFAPSELDDVSPGRETVQDQQLESPAESISRGGVDVDQLQEKLRMMEKKFADVSASVKRLQAEKESLSSFLKQTSQIESVERLEDIKAHIQGLRNQGQEACDEVKRLNKVQAQHESRLQELRDIHRLESSSQSEQIERLKQQLLETEELLRTAGQGAATEKAQYQTLTTEVSRLTTMAKEEEEKRIKAVGLLKTVRQKLVKTEKEKEEMSKSLVDARALTEAQQEKNATSLLALEAQLETTKQENRKEIERWKVEHDKRAELEKENMQRQTADAVNQIQAELAAVKANSSKQVENQAVHITKLETTVKGLGREKEDLFDQVQMRTAELESSQNLLESVQLQNIELAFQLRELHERAGVASTAMPENRDSRGNDGTLSSAEAVTRLLLETEGKYEARLADAREKVKSLEKERIQVDEEWGKTLNEKSRAITRLKEELELRETEKSEILLRRKDADSIIAKLESTAASTQQVCRGYESRCSELEKLLSSAAEREVLLGQELHDSTEQVQALTLQMESSKTSESQLKATNKTIREELRKLQSSVVLLEKQRSPGVGYWSGISQRKKDMTALSVENSRASSSSESLSHSTRDLQHTNNDQSEEEVSFEYLRNIILQFLEHKEMRTHLVRVLSTILQFTPQETRRLMAKV